MSTERRLVLFLVLSLAMMWGMQFLMDQMGLLPKPPKRPVAQKTAAPPTQPGGNQAPRPEAEAAARILPKDVWAKDQGPPAEPTTEPVPPEKLVLGSSEKASPYLLEVRLDQHGAGVASIRSSRYEAEYQKGQPRGLPLELIRSDALAPPSFALELLESLDPAEQAGERTKKDEAMIQGALGDDSEKLAGVRLDTRAIALDSQLWEVIRDAGGRSVRPVTKAAPGDANRVVAGQETAFRTTIRGANGPVILTKRYRLYPGEDGLELELGFESPDADRRIAYDLIGPHGLPIEGEWFTGTFRDVFFGSTTGRGDQILTKSAYDVVKHRDDPERFTSLPLKYAGVENQYFTVFLEPVPVADTLAKSTIEEAKPIVIHADPQSWQTADVSVELRSKPFEVGPNRDVRHSYRIFAGAKTAEALAAFDAFDLTSYRKGWSLPLVGDLGAQFMSKHVIAPMLTKMYAVTAAIARVFGGTRGNYGLAIILLTITVRLILFPLGRKQAKAAKKMQDLQPLLAELKEKYGEDKERMTRETFALYKKHGVNPMGGCLPALIQLPVLIGLWQALNNSVALRHSSFLWIDNLAAPDMLFKWPFDMNAVPLFGHWIGPYFNLLPIVVVALMLVQTKLFSPPATTPEMEQQQKMMKFMMIFMAFLFYKVPSGLGIYFITSSLWQVGERLLLPKANTAFATATATADRKTVAPAKANRAKAGNGGKGGWWSELREQAQQRLEQIMDDAAKGRTVRNEPESRDRGPNRGKPRPKPGRR